MIRDLRNAACRRTVMNQTQEVAAPVLEITARTATLLTLRVHASDADAVLAALDEQVQQAPSMFAGAPVTLDLSALDALPPVSFLEDLVSALRARGIVPTALRGDSELVGELAAGAGLGVLPLAGEAAGGSGKRPAKQAGSSVRSTPTRFVNKPVRSGQQIYAQGGDLVVLAAVGAGAEVVADGCIHIYGALNGRAIAGAQGDTAARILCQQFNAELVSIAGQYQIGDEWSERGLGRPAQVYLDGDALIMEPFDLG